MLRLRQGADREEVGGAGHRSCLPIEVDLTNRKLEMKTFHLTGKTNKGKSRVKEHGSAWETWDIHPSTATDPPFAPGTGTWIRVRSQQTLMTRWIHPTDDPDFSVEVMD